MAMTHVSELNQRFQDWFWEEKFWLGTKYKWSDVDYCSNTFEFFIACLLGAFGIIFLRFVVIIPYILAPIGKRYGLTDTKKKATPNGVLEALYQHRSSPNELDYMSISKQTDLTERYIERWFRYRRNQDIPSQLHKFCDAGFKCMLYTFLLILGLFSLLREEFFWHHERVYTEYPQKPSSLIFFYYWMQLSVYIHFCLTHLRDIKRKDSLVMGVHHIATVNMLFFTYAIGHLRAGVIVNVWHDMADPWMEFAKSSKYIRRESLTTFSFAMLIIVWLLSRLMYLPIIGYHGLVTYPAVCKAYVSNAMFFVGMLGILYILHVYWYTLILRIAIETCKKGNMEQVDDVRSDVEEWSDEGEACETPVDTTTAAGDGEDPRGMYRDPASIKLNGVGRQHSLNVRQTPASRNGAVVQNGSIKKCRDVNENHGGGDADAHDG